MVYEKFLFVLRLMKESSGETSDRDFSRGYLLGGH